MRKVYIKRALLNEDVTITDPTLAQQYLAVKKQMADKKMKRDQSMKTVNQIDNEINILEKNLIAIETKSNSASISSNKEKPAENQQQPTQQTAGTQPTPAANESVSDLLVPREYPTIDEYREAVILAIDEISNDGETLAYIHDDDIQESYELQESPEETARQIVDMDKWGTATQIVDMDKWGKDGEMDEDGYIGGDTQGKIIANRLTPIRKVQESVYSDILNNIENEISKLTSIKDFVAQFNDEEPNVDIDINIDTEDEDSYDEAPPEVLPAIPVETPEVAPLDLTQFKSPGVNVREIDNDIVFPSLEDKDYDNTSDEIEDVEKEEPFMPSEDDRIVDETLKAEDKKKPFVPSLLEDEEELETELDLMNYEDDDEPRDEYVFHIRANPELETEVIAKIYRDSEDDNWTARVVKGDEEPLQSMEFDHRLDKLEIIGYLADMYDEIEIIDPKEYEYLLDDKEKIDKEYYKDELEN
jgi:hypothetical protein